MTNIVSMLWTHIDTSDKTWRAPSGLMKTITGLKMRANLEVKNISASIQ